METTAGLFDFLICFREGGQGWHANEMTKKGEEMLGGWGVFFSVMVGRGGYAAGSRVVISNSILWQSSFIIFSRESGVHKNIPPIFLENFFFLKTRRGVAGRYFIFFWGFWFSFFKGGEVEWSDVWCLGVFFFFSKKKKKRSKVIMYFHLIRPGSRGEGGTFRVGGEGKGFCAKTERYDLIIHIKDTPQHFKKNLHVTYHDSWSSLK